MDLYLSIEAFVRVTESGSFSSAAQQLNVAKSVISTRVQQLEEHLGVSLFHRSSRAVKLSEIGLSYYGDCHDLMERMQSLTQRSKNITVALTGTLRVAALNGFALQHLLAVIETFRKSHPHVEFDVFANDQVVDPVQEGFDIVLQVFPPASESLIERRLFRMRGVFVASPQYLKDTPPISTPDDLCLHEFACYRYYPWRNKWILRRGSQHDEMTLTPVLRSNSVHLINKFAHRAMGIAYLPTMIVWKDLLDGKLVRVLPDYQTEVPYFSAVYPTSHRATAKVKLFLDLLSSTFAMEPEWDQALGISEDLS